MNGGRVVVVWLMLAGITAAATTGPPLPEWKADDKRQLENGMLVPGASLLGEPAAAKPEPPAVPAPGPGDIMEEPVPSKAIPEEFLAEYFEQRPTSYLVDPQKLLTRQEARDRVAFLRYHAGESGVDLYFYLFDREQEVPGEMRAEELVERFFQTGKPAAVVLYFLGAPQRSSVFLSPVMAEKVTAREREQALQMSIRSALEKAEAVDQLDGFSVQLSIRLYRIEKTLAAIHEDEGPLVVLPEKPPKKQPTDRLAPVIARLQPWALPAAGGVGLVLCGMLTTWVIRRRATYRFPAIEVEPRLGGMRGAGVGAVITFGNPDLPPSSQREQVPDYSRRS